MNEFDDMDEASESVPRTTERDVRNALTILRDLKADPRRTKLIVNAIKALEEVLK